MNLKKVDKITFELLNEYSKERKAFNTKEKKLREMSKKIKELLLKDNISHLEKFGFIVEAKDHPQPNQKFVELLIEKDLFHLLNVSCSQENIQKVWDELGNPNDAFKAEMFSVHPTKWLYVTNTEEKKKE